MVVSLPAKAALLPVTCTGLVSCCALCGEVRAMPSVATSVTSQMPPLVLSSRRLSESWIAAWPADGFLTSTTALASRVPPPLTTVARGPHCRTDRCYGLRLTQNRSGAASPACTGGRSSCTPALRSRGPQASSRGRVPATQTQETQARALADFVRSPPLKVRLLRFHKHYL